MSEIKAAIDWFERAISETDEMVSNCSDLLRKELLCQKQHFIVALDALRRPEPRQLTLDELRQMDGQPVWIRWMDWLSSRKDCWVIVRLEGPEGTMWDFETYGKGWVAFDRSPGGDRP